MSKIECILEDLKHCNKSELESIKSVLMQTMRNFDEVETLNRLKKNSVYYLKDNYHIAFYRITNIYDKFCTVNCIEISKDDEAFNYYESIDINVARLKNVKESNIDFDKLIKLYFEYIDEKIAITKKVFNNLSNLGIFIN